MTNPVTADVGEIVSIDGLGTFGDSLVWKRDVVAGASDGNEPIFEGASADRARQTDASPNFSHFVLHLSPWKHRLPVCSLIKRFSGPGQATALPIVSYAWSLM